MNSSAACSQAGFPTIILSVYFRALIISSRRSCEPRAILSLTGSQTPTPSTLDAGRSHAHTHRRARFQGASQHFQVKPTWLGCFASGPGESVTASGLCRLKWRFEWKFLSLSGSLQPSTHRHHPQPRLSRDAGGFQLEPTYQNPCPPSSSASGTAAGRRGSEALASRPFLFTGLICFREGACRGS